MKELHPELEPQAREYGKKRRYAGSLRKLGGRFDLLVRNFSYGILGLLPLPVDELAEELALNVTDNL